MFGRVLCINESSGTVVSHAPFLNSSMESKSNKEIIAFSGRIFSMIKFFDTECSPSTQDNKLSNFSIGPDTMCYPRKTTDGKYWLLILLPTRMDGSLAFFFSENVVSVYSTIMELEIPVRSVVLTGVLNHLLRQSLAQSLHGLLDGEGALFFRPLMMRQRVNNASQANLPSFPPPKNWRVKPSLAPADGGKLLSKGGSLKSLPSPSRAVSLSRTKMGKSDEGSVGSTTAAGGMTHEGSEELSGVSINLLDMTGGVSMKEHFVHMDGDKNKDIMQYPDWFVALATTREQLSAREGESLSVEEVLLVCGMALPVKENPSQQRIFDETETETESLSRSSSKASLHLPPPEEGQSDFTVYRPQGVAPLISKDDSIRQVHLPDEEGTVGSRGGKSKLSNSVSVKHHASTASGGGGAKGGFPSGKAAAEEKSSCGCCCFGGKKSTASASAAAGGSSSQVQVSSNGRKGKKSAASIAAAPPESPPGVSPADLFPLPPVGGSKSDRLAALRLAAFKRKEHTVEDCPAPPETSLKVGVWRRADGWVRGVFRLVEGRAGWEVWWRAEVEGAQGRSGKVEMDDELERRVRALVTSAW